MKKKDVGTIIVCTILSQLCIDSVKVFWKRKHNSKRKESVSHTPNDKPDDNTLNTVTMAATRKELEEAVCKFRDLLKEAEKSNVAIITAQQQSTTMNQEHPTLPEDIMDSYQFETIIMRSHENGFHEMMEIFRTKKGMSPKSYTFLDMYKYVSRVLDHLLNDHDIYTEYHMFAGMLVSIQRCLYKLSKIYIPEASVKEIRFRAPDILACVYDEAEYNTIKQYDTGDRSQNPISVIVRLVTTRISNGIPNNQRDITFPQYMRFLNDMMFCHAFEEVCGVEVYMDVTNAIAFIKRPFLEEVQYHEI